VAIVIAELGFYYSLQNTPPYFPDVMEHDDPWMVSKRQELFSAFALPLGIALLVPAVSLARGIRRDVRHFSRLGHLASACPLFISMLFFLGGFVSQILSYPLVLVSFIIVFMAASRSLILERNYGDLLALPINIGWVVIWWWYLDEWIEAFIW
jgi:hypothetical protein